VLGKRIRDPSLTVLFILGFCAIFLAVPLAVKGLPIARAIADVLVFAVLVMVVMLSHRWGAIILIFLGLVPVGASLLINPQWVPVPATALRRVGDIITFSALTWVVAHAATATSPRWTRSLAAWPVLNLSGDNSFSPSRSPAL
jgi:hypothetical protein